MLMMMVLTTMTVNLYRAQIVLFTPRACSLYIDDDSGSGGLKVIMITVHSVNL